MSNENQPEVILLTAYDAAYPVDVFLQHVRDLRYLRLKGNVTIQSMLDAMKEQWAHDEKLLKAGQEFIEFQLENGAEMSSVAIEAKSEDESTVMHFDFHNN